MRKVQAAADSGSERARLAIAMFMHRLVMTIGGMAAALGGLDALIFTGGIGEHSSPIRSAVSSQLSHLGIALDANANANPDGDDADITAADGMVPVLVITSREDLSVLAEVKRVLISAT